LAALTAWKKQEPFVLFSEWLNAMLKAMTSRQDVSELAMIFWRETKERPDDVPMILATMNGLKKKIRGRTEISHLITRFDRFAKGLARPGDLWRSLQKTLKWLEKSEEIFGKLPKKLHKCLEGKAENFSRHAKEAIKLVESAIQQKGSRIAIDLRYARRKREDEHSDAITALGIVAMALQQLYPHGQDFSEALGQ
jgi:hypothetical protein